MMVVQGEGGRAGPAALKETGTLNRAGELKSLKALVVRPHCGSSGLPSLKC